jgi:hypothetical protein
MGYPIIHANSGNVCCFSMLSVKGISDEPITPKIDTHAITWA